MKVYCQLYPPGAEELPTSSQSADSQSLITHSSIKTKKKDCIPEVLQGYLGREVSHYTILARTQTLYSIPGNKYTRR